MDGFRNRALRVLSATALAAAIVVVPALGTPDAIHDAAPCPNGMMPNPAGYGCVPQRSGGGAVGGNFIGAPSQEMLSACHGGNYYTCIWPYGPF